MHDRITRLRVRIAERKRSIAGLLNLFKASERPDQLGAVSAISDAFEAQRCDIELLGSLLRENDRQAMIHHPTHQADEDTQEFDEARPKRVRLPVLH